MPEVQDGGYPTAFAKTRTLERLPFEVEDLPTQTGLQDRRPGRRSAVAITEHRVRSLDGYNTDVRAGRRVGSDTNVFVKYSYYNFRQSDPGLFGDWSDTGVNQDF